MRENGIQMGADNQRRSIAGPRKACEHVSIRVNLHIGKALCFHKAGAHKSRARPFGESWRGDLLDLNGKVKNLVGE